MIAILNFPVVSESLQGRHTALDVLQDKRTAATEASMSNLAQKRHGLPVRR